MTEMCRDCIAEPLIRADERERALEFCCRDNAADLRAKVLGLPRVTDDYYREAVLLADVLALLSGCTEGPQ